MPGGAAFHSRARSVLSSGGAGAAFATEVNADSPTAWWKYQELSGSTFTDSVGGYVFTGTNATANSAGPGTWGVGVALSGSGSYLTTPDDAVWSAGMGAQDRGHTWETIRYATALSDRFLFGKGNPSNYEYSAYLRTDGSIRWATFLDSNAVNYIEVATATSTIVVNTWTHWMFTCKMKPGGGTTRAYIYKNGTQVAGPGTPTTPGASYGSDGTAALRSGWRADGVLSPFQGTVATDIYYPSELSSSRAAAHYTALQTDGAL